MEQIMTGMLNMIGMNAERQLATATEKSGDTDGFQTMLDQRRSELKDKAGADKTAVKGEEKSQEQGKAEKADQKDGETVDSTEDVAAQAQAMWASMSVMNPPVVQAEVQPVQEVVETAPVVAEVTVEAVPETPVVTEAQAETVIETAAPVTELPAAQETDAEQVNVKAQVNTAEAPVQEKTETVAVKAVEAGEEQEEPSLELESYEKAPEPVFHEVEAAPIKVGEAAPAEESTEVKDVEQQIAEPLAQALEQGESRIQISLTPENLGTVRVELTHSGDGALRVVLSADSPETRTLLEKHITGLHSILAKNEHESVQVEVQRQEQSQQNGSYDGRNGGEQENQPRDHQRQQQGGSQHGQDFLQQLRLGLVGTEEAS